MMRVRKGDTKSVQGVRPPLFCSQKNFNTLDTKQSALRSRRKVACRKEVICRNSFCVFVPLCEGTSKTCYDILVLRAGYTALVPLPSCDTVKNA